MQVKVTRTVTKMERQTGLQWTLSKWERHGKKEEEKEEQ